MKSPCDIVAERVVLGEPLGDQAEHAASCANCRRLAALPAELGATSHHADPGLGFSARMTAGAQHRIVVRRRRRVAAGLAATVAAGTLGVYLVVRHPADPVTQKPAIATEPKHEGSDHDPWDPTEDADVEALLHLADTDSSMHYRAHWKRIEKPLAPYRALVKGLETP